MPDQPVELRRLTLANRGGHARTIEVTGVLEVALQDPAADRDHPAFSKLFVQTGRDAGSGALFARRRPRAAGERWPVLAHAMTGPGRLEVETDRARFLGRGRSAARPAALGEPLSGTVGDVLDPVFATRRAVKLAPGATVALDAVLALGDDLEQALERARAFSDPARVDAAFARGGEVGVEADRRRPRPSPRPLPPRAGATLIAGTPRRTRRSRDEPLAC